jgi:predicted metalloprotease with PDZ domain
MGIGSDHDSYVRKGVPGFFWSQAGRANYTHTHHTQYDTFDAAIPEYQRHTSLVVAIGALAIANLKDMLPREGLRSPTEVVRGPRRTIGVQFEGEGGLQVTSVEDGSPAAKAGVKTGDTLTAVNGAAVKDRFDLRSAILEAKGKAKLTVLRQGKPVELEITLSQQ